MGAESSGRKPPAKVKSARLGRPGGPCGHPSAHEFVSFRSFEHAVRERQAMGAAPEWAGYSMSPIYYGRPTGWAWTVCRECLRSTAAEDGTR